jgi:hypothetical protein
MLYRARHDTARLEALTEKSERTRLLLAQRDASKIAAISMDRSYVAGLVAQRAGIRPI